jgi:hypothetical protein
MSTKTKRGSKYQSYSEILPITSLPIASRRVLAIGRGGNKIKPRKHHLNTAQIDQLKAEFRDSGKIPSPFNKGAYHFTLMGEGRTRKIGRQCCFVCTFAMRNIKAFALRL